MSWLARSLVNTLRGEEDEDESNHESKSNEGNPNKSSIDRGSDRQQDEDDDDDPTRGVKEDLTELTKTLTRQFWGVASFLAPPPSSADSPPSDRDRTVANEGEGVSSPRLGRIRSDFAEIGGRFKSGIAILSNTKAVSEISKIASTFLPFGSEEDEAESEEVEEKYEGEAVGITDEVLAFARNISMHPETWLDFPLIPDEDDSDEFDMSDAQQEHALAVEHFAPPLAALRIELCPSHMSEGRFWKIYFVLLHSRLNRPDTELLTTPQVVQAREMLLQDLQTRKKPSSSSLPKEADASVPPSEAKAETSSIKTLTIDQPSTSIPITDHVTEKHPVETIEVKIIDKSVIEEDTPVVDTEIKEVSSDASNYTVSIQKYEEDVDDAWLQEEEVEETVEAGGYGVTTAVPLGNDEDVSFSDLEEDEDQIAGDSQLKSGPHNKESGDWLSV